MGFLDEKAGNASKKETPEPVIKLSIADLKKMHF